MYYSSCPGTLSGSVNNCWSDDLFAQAWKHQESAHFLVKRDLTNSSSHVLVPCPILWLSCHDTKYVIGRIDTYSELWACLTSSTKVMVHRTCQIRLKPGHCFRKQLCCILHNSSYHANYYEEWRNARQDVDIYIYRAILHFGATVAEESPRPSEKPASTQESSLVCLLSLK